jgi:signal transduction histidine kinase
VSRRGFTIRARLTLVYGGLFLLGGAVLLGFTYVLASAKLVEDIPLPGAVRPAAPPASAKPPAEIDPPSSGPDPDLPGMIREARENALTEALSQGAIALAVVGVAAIGAGWLLAGRLLQPLQRITDTARRIADAPNRVAPNLGERIALSGPRDEITELAATFDHMLARLDHSFDGQRRFIANASHELRTPLTLTRTLIEVATDNASTETRELGTALLDINTRHERLIDGLLLLARSERELARRTYVDLADITEHVLARQHRAVTVLTDLRESPTTGDAVLLEQLVHNLVDNAVKHNLPADGWVRVTTEPGPADTVLLRVSNTGPPVPDHEAPRLFEPFHRLDGDRLAATAGTGLGLSIVRAVAGAHGGAVLAEPRADGGLVVTVTLPAAL